MGVSIKIVQFHWPKTQSGVGSDPSSPDKQMRLKFLTWPPGGSVIDSVPHSCCLRNQNRVVGQTRGVECTFLVNFQSITISVKGGCNSRTQNVSASPDDT